MITVCVPVQVIARLGSLVTVNAATVTAYERKDSELRYMRTVLGMYFCAVAALQVVIESWSVDFWSPRDELAA